MRLRLPETCLSRVSERTEKNSTEGCFLSCGTYCNPLSQFTIVEHAFARGGVIHFTASEQVEQVEQVTTRKNRVGMPGRPEADSHVSVLPPTELLLSCLQLCKNGGGVHFFTTSKVERDNACAYGRQRVPGTVSVFILSSWIDRPGPFYPFYCMCCRGYWRSPRMTKSAT